MPNVSVNFFTFAMYWSSSPCTKRFQRSTRSFAPFSGSLRHCAAARLTQMNGPTTTPVARVALAFSTSRRLFALIGPSLSGAI